MRLGDLPRLEGSTPEAHLDELVGAARPARRRAYAFDVTSPDVRSLGLRVVRVARPRAVPAGRLAHRALPRGRAAVHRAPRRRPRCRDAPTRRRQPASRIRSRDRPGRTTRASRGPTGRGRADGANDAPPRDRPSLEPGSDRGLPRGVARLSGDRRPARRAVPHSSSGASRCASASRARSSATRDGRSSRSPSRGSRTPRCGSRLALRRSQPRLRRPRAPARRARDDPPCRLRRHGSADRHGTGAPHGSVGGRALSARAVRRMQPRRRGSNGRSTTTTRSDTGWSASAPISPDALAELSPYGEVLASSAAVVLVTGVFWRSRFKYGDRAYRFTLLEAGHVGQNVVLAATALGLASVPIGGFFDRRADAFLGIDGLHEASLYLVPARRRRGDEARRVPACCSGRRSRWPRLSSLRGWSRSTDTLAGTGDALATGRRGRRRALRRPGAPAVPLAALTRAPRAAARGAKRDPRRQVRPGGGALAGRRPRAPRPSCSGAPARSPRAPRSSPRRTSGVSRPRAVVHLATGSAFGAVVPRDGPTRRRGRGTRLPTTCSSAQPPWPNETCPLRTLVGDATGS